MATCWWHEMAAYASNNKSGVIAPDKVNATSPIVTNRSLVVPYSGQVPQVIRPEHHHREDRQRGGSAPVN